MEELVRLQKVIAERGICSRRKAEELILNNKVYVNGTLVNTLGVKVNPNADIKVIGYEDKNKKENLKTFVFNKPLGVVSTSSDDRNRKTVVEFFKNENLRVYPVGRLDFNTAGCLLVTNDGELSNLITHPSSNIEKTYIVTVEGYISNESLSKLKNGIMLEDGLTAPSRIQIGKRDEEVSIFKITIHEGRNRQVRRMCEAVNHKVKSLYRESIDFINCNNLKRGEYRLLSQEEVDKLKNKCLENKKGNIIPSYKKR